MDDEELKELEVFLEDSKDTVKNTELLRIQARLQLEIVKQLSSVLGEIQDLWRLINDKN